MSQPPRPGPAQRVSLPTLSPSSRLYVGTEAGGSALLLAATLLALAWANSPWSAGYDAFWSTQATLGVGGLELSLDLRHWVNDAAMALFFLVVGLEITREVSTGELRDRRNLAAPALGALGGLAVPALLYWRSTRPAPRAAAGASSCRPTRRSCWVSLRCSDPASPPGSRCSCSPWRSSTTSARSR